ncbi:hypothetical protein BJ912DRAFT_1061708 [Pholiota molesta]|nr:hypothetical protein BJ912DRAFT_1061708 [Pholiota molesta]
MSKEMFMDYSLSELSGQNDQRPSMSHAQLQVGMGSRTATSQVFTNHESGFNNQSRQPAGYGPGTYQQTQGQIPAAMLAQIQSVSQERLFASENQAFMALYMENIRLKTELDVRSELLAHFKEKDKHPARPHHSDNHSDMHTSSAPQLVPHAPTLDIPPSPELLSIHDYYEAQAFWDHEKWKEHDKKERASGRVPPRLGFVVDVEGNAVSSARLTQMSSEANILWTTLFSTREDPPSWKKKTKAANDFFSNSMRSKFIEFRLCEGDWKVEVFATTKFSDWNRNLREKGNLKRTMPSINAKSGTSKRKGDDLDTKPRLAKKIKLEKPAASEVIDLDSDGDSIGGVHRSSPIAGSSTSLASATTTGPKTPTRVTPPSSEPHSQSGNRKRTAAPIPNGRVSSSAKGSTVAMSPTREPHPKTPFATAAVDRPDVVKNTTQGVAPLEPPPPTIATEVAKEGAAAAAQGAADDTGTPPTEPAISKIAPRPGRRGRAANPLSGIAIPKPADELLAPIVASETAPVPSSSSKPPPVAKPTTKKGVKLMAPNKSTTARNLFAIDYLKMHQVTPAEFKVVYAALDEDTLKKYEALSREKKKTTNQESEPTA